MNATVLVVTTVHHPDDTRIRERLIRTLGGAFSILYAARLPGPSDVGGLTWVPLPGGRATRNARALRALLRRRWDLAVVHDPELVPAATVARLVRRRPVVFDVHEDLPAQIDSKTWIPAALKPLVRLISRGLLWLAERTLTLSLAEESYQHLFKTHHRVFPNYPHDLSGDMVAEGDGAAIYVGDVSEERGVGDAVRACAMADVPLTVVGPVSVEMSRRLHETSRESGGEVTLLGRLSHGEAMSHVAGASVGLSPLRAEPNYVNSLPTKTLEYLAMGVPVVATDLPGTRDHIADLAAVELVEPGDVRSMAAAIATSADHSVKRAALAQAEEVRSRYRWPAEEVLGFYASLVNQ